MNADEAITVKVGSDTIADAQAALDRHEVYAILAIPKDTESQVLRGDKARIAAYVDAAYFLLYSRTLQGISEAARRSPTTLRRVARGATAALSMRRWPAASRRSISFLNRCSTRQAAMRAMSSSRLSPYPSADAAAWVASLGGAAYALGGADESLAWSGARAVFGQGLAHLCFALPGLALYLIVLPRVYGFSTLGRLEDLVLMAVPFVLSVSFLAQFVSAWFTAARLQFSFSSLSACQSFFRLVSPGRSKPFPISSGPRAASFPARRPSMASFGSIRWERASLR